ncbi:MAG: hypothetical protein HRU09_00300 [Oligoflexales bacterium]|nr:hypothetical protein [Oligoflexales bacterium]
MNEEVTVSRNGKQLVIDGIENGDDGYHDWTAFPFSNSKILLSYEGDPLPPKDYKNGFGWLPVETFADILRGRITQKWTGMVAVDTALGLKRIFMVQGEIVFARSNLVDDRLGEVIYRDGDLSLEELTSTTAQVSRERKFGQVLVLTGLFDHLKLWHSLKAQVEQIVRSIFMESFISVGFYPNHLPTSEVHFDEGSLSFLDKCLSFGSMYRGFEKRLAANCKVSLLDEHSSFSIYPQGTFLGDVLRLINESKDLGDLMRMSKVQPLYTISALMLLINEGFCEIGYMRPFKLPGGVYHILSLKSKINMYEFLIQEQRRLFELENFEYPVQELKSMAFQLNEEEFPVIFLNDFGFLHPESLHHVFNQCITVAARTQYFESAVDSLMRFSMQISADRLSYEGANKIKSVYKDFIYK